MNAMVTTATSLNEARGSGPAARPASLPSKARERALCLTRRGRLVLFGVPALTLAAALIFTSMGIFLGSFASPAHASAQLPVTNFADYATTVTVLQGDSLWSIAGESNPNRNIREVVQEIVALNDLGAGVLHAGQQLFVPRPR